MKKWQLDGIILIGLIVIGWGLRFAFLDSKPPWADEFSTLVFSLGNSFRGIPLNEIISLSTLLEPLQINPQTTHQDVIHHLITESNHPPVYFVLAHWWMNLINPTSGYVSLWGARAFPAFLGVLSIPLTYLLARVSFYSSSQSRLIALFSAGMMSISPYGIYLAQEARHYTFSVGVILASFIFFVKNCQENCQGRYLSIGLGIVWMVINCLGVSGHYFFSLALCIEGIVLGLVIRKYNQEHRPKINIFHPSLQIPIWGSLGGCLIWIPVFAANSYGSKLTEWIQGERVGLGWISPLIQAISGWVPMISLLPVEAASFAAYPGMVIACSLVMVLFFLWLIPVLITGFRSCFHDPEMGFPTYIFSRIVLTGIGLFFTFTYLLNIDLTRGARYNFVYFPAVIILLGEIGAWLFQQERVQSQILRFPPMRMRGKQAVFLIGLMGVASALTVVTNFGYQKFYKPDLLVKLIQETSSVPVLISTLQKTHVEMGELMGIGWQWKERYPLESPQFLLIHSPERNREQVEEIVQKNLQQISTPVDLWLVNFHGVSLELKSICEKDRRSFPEIDGYGYQVYHCFPPNIPLGGKKS